MCVFGKSKKVWGEAGNRTRASCTLSRNFTTELLRHLLRSTALHGTNCMEKIELAFAERSANEAILFSQIQLI